MHTIHTNSVQETEAVGRAFATRLHGGCVVALFGGMGMGKTAFVRGLALELVDVFLDTPFEGGRHQRRIDQITAIEQEEL